MPRYFTRSEAQALLPLLSSVLAEIQEQKRLFDNARAGSQSLTSTATGNGHVAEEQAWDFQEEMRRTADRLNELVQQVTGLGAELKDAELGLVDFHTIREGRDVYLCWRLGEREIAYWHELDTGYAGRQPLEPNG